MSRTTVITVLGSAGYTLEMMSIAKRYELMGCVVLQSFINEGDEYDQIIVSRVRARIVEMADLIHVVHYNNLDYFSAASLVHARHIGKPITYCVPSQSYINTFSFKDDNFILGPLHWATGDLGFYLADITGKRVFVLERGQGVIA